MCMRRVILKCNLQGTRKLQTAFILATTSGMFSLETLKCVWRDWGERVWLLKAEWSFVFQRQSPVMLWENPLSYFLRRTFDKAEKSLAIYKLSSYLYSICFLLCSIFRLYTISAAACFLVLRVVCFLIPWNKWVMCGGVLKFCLIGDHWLFPIFFGNRKELEGYVI